VLLACRAVVDGQPGIGVVAGHPAPAGEDRLGHGDVGASELELTVPAADEVAHPVVRPVRCRPGSGVAAQHRDRGAVVVVLDGRPPLDHVAVGAHPVVQGEAQGVVPVVQPDAQVAAVDVVAGVAPLDAAGAVGEAHEQAGRSEAGAALHRQFVHRGHRLEAARRGGNALGNLHRLGQGQRGSPVDVPHGVVLGEPDGVRGGRAAQQPQAVIGIERHRGHQVLGGTGRRADECRRE
jgi:hypothetical protein